MRIVIGLLLAVNALLFYWITQQSSQQDAMVAEISTNMPPLELLSETVLQKTEIAPSVAMLNSPPTIQNNTEQEKIEKPPTRAVFLELSCYSIGPFLNEKAVKSASSRLTELDVASEYKSEVRREVNGFWVFIPPLPSRSEARKVIEILKERGIKDFLIISNGKRRNAISLGFFGTHDGAEQHQTRMKALGLNPILEQSFREVSGFWLDFSSPNSPPLPESVVEAFRTQYDEVSMKKRPCLK